MADMMGIILDKIEALSRRLSHLEALDYSLDAQNADTVDGIHAATVATANKLLALDASAKLPASITGDASNADTVDGEHAAGLHAAGSLTGTVPLARFPTLDGCRLTKTGNQTLSNATPTVVAFDAETFDAGGLHDNVTNNSRVTIATAGKYIISGTVAISDAVDTIAAGWRLDGTTVTWGDIKKPPSGGEEGMATFTDVASLAAGNYIELMAYQNSGGTSKTLLGAETHLSVMFWSL